MKFAFLVHPLSQEHRALLAVDDSGRLRRSWGGDIFQFCQMLHRNLAASRHHSAELANDVRIVDHLTDLESATGARCQGRIYEIPLDAAQILDQPHVALNFMEQAVDDAAVWGAEIVGLGSMTGIVGSHGQHLADRGPVAITTGNSLTVYSARQNLLRACELCGIRLQDEIVAIVGVPGSIAAALAKLVAPHCHSLICVGRSRNSRAIQLAESLKCDLSVDIREALQSARIVISATSSGDCIHQDWLLPGSLVIDVAVPTDVIGNTGCREDVLILTGGMLQVPPSVSRESTFIGFNHGMIPSCFGETMLLALENRRECFSVGRNLCVDGIMEIGRLAQEHGFDFSHLSSFGVPVEPAQVVSFKKHVRKVRRQRIGRSLPKRQVSATIEVDQDCCSTEIAAELSLQGVASSGVSAGSSICRDTELGNNRAEVWTLPGRNGIYGEQALNGRPAQRSISGDENHVADAGENRRSRQAVPLESSSTEGPPAIDQHERYINPVLVALGKRSGFPKTFVRGEGCYLWDEQGRRYLDFVSGFGSLNLGHNHPAVVDAVQTALTIAAPGFAQAAVNPFTARLADRLVSCSPRGLEMVTFANSGAEAIEAAIKLVRGSSNRSRILYCHGSYHGKTLGALSITGNPKFQKPFAPLLEGTDAVEFGDLPRLTELLRTQNYAAFFVEPIQCEGGMVVPPAGYLSAVQGLCRETGTRFVLDEIQTGLGRTGRLFCAEHFDLEPDIITLAKSLGGGLIPCAAMLCSRAMWLKAYGSVETFALHSSTFAGGSLASVAGLATLDVLENSELMEMGEARAQQLREGLEELGRTNDLIADVRGLGLLIGVEFHPLPSNITRHFAAHDPTGVNSFLAPQALDFVRNLAPIYVMQTLLDEYGIYTQIARSRPSVLRIQPPLIVDEAQIAEFLQAFQNCCEELSFSNRITDSMISKSTLGKLDKGDKQQQSR